MYRVSGKRSTLLGWKSSSFAIRRPHPLVSRELLIAFWAVAGVAALLVRALGTLGPIAVEAVFDHPLSLPQWGLLTGWVVFNAYAEGVMGFHRKFSPRVASRALALGKSRPGALRILLAAPYAMGLFDAPRRVMLTSWTVLAFIVALVATIRYLAQPWRGIIDAGVVVGLAIGLASLVWCFARALGARDGAAPASRS